MHPPIRRLRRTVGLSQRRLAELASTTQPTIHAYESGRKSPTWRAIRRLAGACGLEAVVVFVPPLTREDRVSLALHELVAEHVRVAPEPALARARRNLATMLAANPHAEPLLGEWSRILDEGPNRVSEVLGDPGEHARALRQVSPFAGLLSAAERRDAIEAARAAR